MLYEITLVHKEKRHVSAESAADAVEHAMKDVETAKPAFAPTQWTVKEKEEEE